MTIETEGTNRTAFITGMTITKTGTGLTTEDDQLNINTKETNQGHR